ncbi:TRAP transporter small permease [Elioraea rosea]|uniref:TRAP transporter small permease n=1 Tax=Elioraea rosea TaxID=2492390 RepID=UPI001183A705|nr:TRAP transporter small permease [Elioraea rosea]
MEARTEHALARAARSLAALVLRLVDIAIALTILGLFGIVASQVIDRNIAPFWRHSPEEYVKVGLVWLCFLGFARVYAAGEAIRITFVHDALPRRVQSVMDIAFDLLAITVLVVIVWKGLVFLQIAQMQMILGTDLTLAVPGAGLVFGCALMLATAVVRVAARLAALVGQAS